MAARVNIKFIGILFIAVAAAAAVVGVLWMLQYKMDATRNMRTGDAMMEAGDYRMAKEAYGRAVAKDQTNLEYLRKYEEAILAYQPQTSDEAREWYDAWLSVLSVDARYRGADPATHVRFITELVKRGKLVETDAMWQQVETAADRMWDVVPADNPDRILAKLYRGLAIGRRVTALSADEVLHGVQDLEDFLEARPDSDSAWASLVMTELAMVERYRAEGRTTLFQEAFDKLMADRQKGLESVPSGFEMAMANARVMAYQQRLPGTQVTDTMVEDALGRVIDLAETSDDRLLLLQFVQLMHEMRSTEAIRVAVGILRDRVEDDPQAMFEHLAVARAYMILSDLDNAEQFAESVINAPRLKTSLVSQTQFSLRREAARVLVDVAVRRWDVAAASDKPALMERVDKERERLHSFVTDETDPLLLWADGRIALIKSDYQKAAACFDQYLKQRTDTADPETMLLSAKALEEIQQYGGALERVWQVAELVPNNPQILAQKARLEFNVGRKTEALATLARAEQLAPNNPDIIALKRAMQNREDGPATRLSMNESVNSLLVEAREALTARDLDGARELLRQAERIDPNDLATLKMGFNVEIAAGDLDAAREISRKALRVAPNDVELLRVSSLLEHDDPIDAIKSYVTATNDDEGERAIALLLNLRAVMTQQEAKARQLEAAGKTEEAAEARRHAERAKAEAVTAEELANTIAPNNAALIEHLFVTATLARDWDTANRMVDRAGAADTDRAGGSLYKGRLALARANYEEAVRSFLNATNKLSYSAYAWRLLGMAYEGVGNVTDAQRAYERSYNCNPNDLATLRLYCELLVRVGDPTRAITVLRTATNLLADTAPAVEYWLGLEATYGDVSVVMKRRRAMFERSRNNTQNALKLATLLGQVEPRREIILGADGNPKFSGQRWDRLTVSDQKKELDAAREAWLTESENILTELEKQGVRGLAVVNVRARNALARKQPDQGEKLLRDFVAEQEAAGTVNINMMLALGQYLADANRNDEARDVFIAARELQSPEGREADMVLGDLYFRTNRFDQAAETYQRVVDAGRTGPIAQRLAECYIKTRKFDEAEHVLKALEGDSGAAYVNAMLEAAIAEGRGEDLYVAGRKDDAKKQFALQRKALDRAISLAPAQPMPHVQRAISYLAEYGREKKEAVLQDAMESLDTAAAMRADFPPVSITRADVLIARGNLDAAIGELGRLLQKAPESISVRRRLIELLLDSGRLNEAGTRLLEATTLFPNNSIWFERYGDLKVVQNEVNAAEPMYAQAYAIDPSTALLAKLSTARLRMVPPNYRGAAELLGARQDEMNADPVLRGIFAEALNGLGRRSDAMQQMRLAHRQFRDAIAGGKFAPEMISQWYVQLRKLFEINQFAEAEQFVRELASESINVYDLQWLARFWADSDRNGTNHAIELQLAALEKCPQENQALRIGLLNDLSLFYSRVENHDRSIEVMQQIIAEQPDNAMTLNNIAFLMGMQGKDIDKALQYIQDAKRLRPNDPNIHDTEGYLYMLAKEYDKAEESFRQSVQIFPMASTYVHLAQLQFLRGESRFRVETSIRRAEELNPDAQTRTEINRLLDDMRKTSP